MLFDVLRALARVRVTVAYAAILTGVTTALMTLDPRAQSRIISHASTNLHNLSRGHLGTLFASAFVVDAGPVVAFVVGHVGATLLVAIGLTAAVELGWLSTDITRATDVGMSYGASAVLGSLTATRFGQAARWTPLGWLLLVAGAGFGYLMLAGSGPTLIAATAAGVCGAALAELAVGRRRAREVVSRDAALNRPSPMIAGWLISP